MQRLPTINSVVFLFFEFTNQDSTGKLILDMGETEFKPQSIPKELKKIRRGKTLARKWEISPWTLEWNQQYELESKALKQILYDELLEIHHVGSTSVKSIGYAKPIIDILMKSFCKLVTSVVS